MSLSTGVEFLVQWHLTERCNLHCRHCYQEGELEGAELDAVEALELLDEISAMFRAWEAYSVRISPSFNITGGEPLLRGDFWDLLEEMRRQEFPAYLLTNGTLIGRREAEELKRLGVRGVQVSIEGEETAHDRIRGAGAFAAAATGAAELSRAGLPVTINMTLSRANSADFLQMPKIAASLGAVRFGFARLVPSGCGEAMLGELLSPEEVRDLYSRLWEMEEPGIEFVSSDPLAFQLRAAAPATWGGFPEGGCAAGVSGFTILAAGEVVPCRRLPISLGNVRTDSLRGIWAASPVLAALRDRNAYHGKCTACDRWAVCRGCRGVAYAWARAHGVDDFLAPDPQCFFP